MREEGERMERGEREEREERERVWPPLCGHRSLNAPFACGRVKALHRIQEVFACISGLELVIMRP